MSLYLDASVLVALFTDDPFTRRAESFLRANAAVVVVSDFAAAEFTSVIARHVRTRSISLKDASIVFAAFDSWTARVSERAEICSADVTAAKAYLRRLDLNLRTPDALNIAIADRLGSSLVTFDERMAAAARALGASVATA